MARIRSLKPTFWTDEKIGVLPRDVRLTFIGLISAMADDHGRLVGSARIVRGAVYPYDDDMTVAMIGEHLDVLAAAGRIHRYSVNGDDYIQITNWSRHQRVDKPSPSLLPPPPDSIAERSANDPGTLPTEGKGEGTEGEKEKERDGERSGAEGVREPAPIGAPAPASPGSPPSVPSPADELASLIGALPPEARQILDTFYEPALTEPQRVRWRQVAMQLVDALDPKHPGPKIRGGVRVKARSVEHMADVCRAVLRDPPMDRDAAVVFVLKKLLDPPKGPSVTEKAKRQEQAAVQLEETYHREAQAAAVQWAKEHPVEYEPIRLAVEATYSRRSGPFAETAKRSELTQRCAKAAGFPSFDAWRRDRQPPEARSA